MKKFLFQLFICLTCLNIGGGYAIAAGITSRLNKAPALITTDQSEGLYLKKSVTPEIQLLQLTKQETEEDDSINFQFFSLANSEFDYQFIPDFQLVNKHFLVHYGKAIKGNLPALFLLNSVFRL